MKTKLLPVFIIFVLFSLTVFAQAETNLEIINHLIEKSVARVDSLLGGKGEVFLSMETSSALEVLKPSIYNSFVKRGYVLKTASDAVAKSIDYTIVSAKVEYTDSFSNGIFGGTLLQRQIKLDGSTVIKGEDKTLHPFQFKETSCDTISLDDISYVEDQTLPFTQAQLPSLPLLSNLWEPIIAVGTLTVTVILLFTVRSK